MRLLIIGLFATTIGLAAEAIDTFRTVIAVHSDGTLRIEETIRYDFGSVQRHGIYRDIPLEVKVDRLAPKVPLGIKNFTVKMDDHPVPFSHSTISSRTDGKMAQLRIGDPHSTLSGRHTYTIAYDVAHGVFPSSLLGMEAIRWNAVGGGWNLPVHHAVADLILPEVLDRQSVRLAAFTGRYGSTNLRADYRWIDERHARFTVNDLHPHEGFTIEANYPEGQLAQSSNILRGSGVDRLMGHWHWGGLVAFFLFVWQYARRLGLDTNPKSIAPQYYPPKDLSLLQSGLLLDKFADLEDFPAAILELGALGYLEINQSAFDDEPVIIRTQTHPPLEALTPDQRYLYSSILFAKGDIYVIKKRVNSGKDSYKIEETNAQLNTVNKMLYNWSVSEGWMRANPQQIRKDFLWVAVGVGGVLILALAYSMFRLYGFDLLMIGATAISFVSMGGFTLIKALKKRKFSMIFFGAVWLGSSLFILNALLSDFPGGLGALLVSPLGAILGVIGLIGYFYRRIGQLTPKGQKMCRYLMGYKDFMAKVERNRIRRFLKEDPHYLDRGLPYAMLFGLNDHWIDFYEALQVATPSWYHGDLSGVGDFTQAFASQSVPSASGIGGGGSFSGGGGGGGGGGSW
jgi:uncharacterized membrane protein YgcG